jgi:hypothetical protein
MKRMTWFAWAALMATTLALASRLGVVNFANGSTQPTKIPAGLVAQAQAAARGHGRVILLRGGASPVGSASFNFVLSGERVAAIRDQLVDAGIPRKKIVSQFVGVVSRGSAAKDRAVIIDATTRAALGLAPANAGEAAALARLEAQVAALEAAHKAQPKTAPAIVKPRARHEAYTGSAWYSTRTTQFNNGGSIVGESYIGPLGGGGVAGADAPAGDNYQQKGYGFDLRKRHPVHIWTIPLKFSVAGLSQTQQVANPVMSGTQGSTFNMAESGGQPVLNLLLYPLDARDSVSTQFLHGSIQSPWKVWGMTVTPGIKIGWLGEQSLSGGSATQMLIPGCTPSTNGGQACATVTVTSTAAVGGSALSVTPSLSIGGQGWQVGYSQSPWGADGYYSPRVLMGTAAGHGVSLSLGVAFPDCPMCSAGGATISLGKIVKVGVHGGGWGAGLIYVAGEQFEAGGMVMPATLAQALAPFDPSRPWNSYNPGLTLTVSKKLTKDVSVAVTYGLDHQGGSGYSVGMPNVPIYQGSSGTPIVLPSPGTPSATIKTEEISLRGRF